MLKLSRYSIPITPHPASGITPESHCDDDDDIVALYSTSTGNYITLTPSRIDAMTRGMAGEINPADTALCELVEYGFLVRSDMDESAVMKHAFTRNRRALHAPHLTIAPTMNCNFGCEYCFEEHKPGQMSQEIQARVAALLSALLERSSSDRASVTWFGGEPLMGLRTIRALTKSFRELARLKAVEYDIITNGYLMTPSVSRELVELGVTKAQITLDGSKRRHDARRVLKGSSTSTWDRIIPNILAAPRALTIVIRVNVDWNNVDDVVPMCEALESAGVFTNPNVFVNLGRVENFTTGVAPAGAMSSVEFANESMRIRQECAERGWPVSSHEPKVALSGVCQVDSLMAFVVDPKGLLYKCWADLENNGNVVLDLARWDGTTDPCAELGILAARDPFDDEECVSCFFLPSCLGSCPKVRHLGRLTSGKECPPAKFLVHRWAWRTHGNRDVLKKRITTLANLRLVNNDEGPPATVADSEPRHQEASVE